MAKAKFEKLTVENTSVPTTHADLQKKVNTVKKQGRPVGSKVKKEQANVPLTISITPSQKEAISAAAKNDGRSVSNFIKQILIEKEII